MIIYVIKQDCNVKAHKNITYPLLTLVAHAAFPPIADGYNVEIYHDNYLNFAWYHSM